MTTFVLMKKSANDFCSILTTFVPPGTKVVGPFLCSENYAVKKPPIKNQFKALCCGPTFFLVLQKGFLFLKKEQFPNIKKQKLGTFYSLFFLPEKNRTA